MSGFSDLPKFPKDEAVDFERMHEGLRRRPEPPDRLADRVRHAWPAWTFLVVAAVAVFTLFLFTQYITVYVGCGALIGIPLLTYVIWRTLGSYRPD